MRFALVGDHPDGVDMACALVTSGRHELAVYCGPTAGAQALGRKNVQVNMVSELEEVLADPGVDAVIVASPLSVRSAQLRRALQSERHVLCVYPSDDSPDTAYEAAMIQGDTRRVLLPLLTRCLHPAVARLADLVRTSSDGLGETRLLVMEWRSTRDIFAAPEAGNKPSIPGWDVLRRIGGEIAEVFAYASGPELTAGAPALLAGAFAQGGLFQVTFLPESTDDECRITIYASRGEVRFSLRSGWQGPAHLSWHGDSDPNSFNAEPAATQRSVQLSPHGDSDSKHEESWNAWSPWLPLVTAFEDAVAQTEASSTKAIRPTWHDATRGLELDDAARRSVERRRASTLEYQEATEEASFKGTMTLVGCGMLWGMILLLILSHWVPQLGWIILPLLAVFIVLQFLRWLVPRRQA
jgi:predicted dehydrogenase